MGVFKKLDLSIFQTEAFMLNLMRAALYLIIGFIVLRIIILSVRRLMKNKVSDQVKMLATKAINYSGLAIIIIIVLLEFGVNLAPILGAAGILGLAIGIASQASLSNIISGLFLISEKPFKVGDIIRSGDKLGIVVSIDLLSAKIRTFNNIYIRIPNEKLANSELMNITRYPIRRMDFNISVAYKEDLERVREILLDIAKDNALVLDEPSPILIFQEFGDSGISILFGVWFQKSDFIDVKNAIFLDIKKRFDQEGIEIPFPHRTLYAGSATDPLPIVMKEEKAFDED